MVNRRTCRGYQSQAGNFSCITTVVLKSFTLAWKSCKLDINAMKENKSPFGTNHYNCKTEIATIQGSLKYCAQLVKCRKWPGCFATFQWSQNLVTPKIIRLCVGTFWLVRYCHAGDLLEDHLLTLLPFLIADHPLNCVTKILGQLCSCQISCSNENDDMSTGCCQKNVETLLKRYQIIWSNAWTQLLFFYGKMMIRFLFKFYPSW